jgi:hypothetical protein
LNSEGDMRLIKLLAEVGDLSVVIVSSGAAGLNRPVTLSDERGPLPLGLASVVIEMKRIGERVVNGATKSRF